MVDYNLLKAVIVQSMYGTNSWPLLTTFLDMLLTGDTKDALNVLIELTGGAVITEESKQLFLGVIGIHCGDRTVRIQISTTFAQW